MYPLPTQQKQARLLNKPVQYLYLGSEKDV